MAITLELPSGQKFIIENDSATIGRSSDNDIAIPDSPEIQPVHAIITQAANKWMIESAGDWLLQVGNGVPGRKLWLKPNASIRLSESGPIIIFEPANAGVIPTSKAVPVLAKEPPSLPPLFQGDEPPPLPSSVNLEEPPPLPPLFQGVELPPLPSSANVEEPPPLPSSFQVDEPPPLPSQIDTEEPPPLPMFVRDDAIPPPFPQSISSSNPSMDERNEKQIDMYHSNRPEKVGTAVMLLYITLGIGVLRGIMEWPSNSQPAEIGFVLFIALAVLGIIWFFIYMIGKGRNWARITFLVLFILGIPFSIVPLLQSLAATPISGLLGIGQTVIQIIALVFLFQKPSSDWFREMKAQK